MTPSSAPRGVVVTAGPLAATIRPPGSKSETNRVLVCAALADGASTLTGVLIADDTEAMLDGVAALGIDRQVEPTGSASGNATVRVVGCNGRPPGGGTVGARLSGTTSRFLVPVAALGGSPSVIDGAAPLRERPMADLLDAVVALGGGVQSRGVAGHLPVRVGDPRISGGRVALRGDVSSQFLSALLLAGPCLPAGLHVELTSELVSVPYVALTLDVMARFGAHVEGDVTTSLSVEPTGYAGTEVAVEADATAASYVMAAPLIAGGGVRGEGVGSASAQGDAAFAEVLRAMGAEVRQGSDWTEVVSTGELHGIDVDLSDMSDTAQTLAAVAPFASSPTTVRGIGFIRAKETDRIAAVVTELQRLGVDAVAEPDGFTIRPGRPSGGVVQTYGDHRMAMSFSLIGLAVPGVVIADPGCVDKTYPSFWDDLDRVVGSAGPGPSPATL